MRTRPCPAGLAESSADALHGLLPGLDHLQHMPSHNYMRVGRWSDAVQVGREGGLGADGGGWGRHRKPRCGPVVLRSREA